MSKKCPLCGNSKADESLFCPDCTDRLNEEYEVELPTSEKNKRNVNEEHKERSTHSIQADSEIQLEEKEEKLTQSKSDERAKYVPAPNFDKKAWRRQREDKRSYSNKSYYELEKENKSPKRIGIIALIAVLLLTLVGFIYVYNNSVKSDNLERSKWEVAQRENTVDSYLSYMDEYPQGKYADEAYNSVFELKNKETAAFERLKSSDNTSELTSFLEQYPESPYQRIVRDKLDSLVWQSSLKENSLEAYKTYINKSNSKELVGSYIGEAKKRFNMLNQSAPIDGGDLEHIKMTVDKFFSAISNKSKTTLNEYLAPVISRFNNTTNLQSNEMINHLLQQASKENATALQIDAETSQIQYIQMSNGTYEVNVPIQKTFEGTQSGTTQIKGYIVHLKLSQDFKIYSYHESKPYPEAP